MSWLASQESNQLQQRFSRLQSTHHKVLPVSRAVLYKQPDPKAEILFGQRFFESSNHRGCWELLGGKLENNSNQSSAMCVLESPLRRAEMEICQEALLPFDSFSHLPILPTEHLYTLDDSMSRYDGYLIWTIVQYFALYHSAVAQHVRTPEHQNHVWLTAEEALDAHQSGRFDLHPQARFMLPKLVHASRQHTWR